MADIKRLLNKKSWTGRELGILELTNMAVMFKQALDGKEKQTPIVEEAQLKKMIKGLKDRQEGKIYNNYISIHEWLSIQYNIAETQYQQAQVQTSTLLSAVVEASMIEDVYDYREKLPCIMTQKQYDKLIHDRIEEYFTDEDGTDASTDVFFLIEDTISHFLKKLDEEPDKPNYLKAIRKKYEKEPVGDKRLYEVWNCCTGNGYWTLEDGRRSDEMTDEEWDEALVSGGADVWEQANIIFNSDTQEEINDKLSQTYFAKTEWHDYPAPTDLKKWDVIKEDNLVEFFEYDPEDPVRLEEMVAEFPELIEATLKEIDKVLGTKLSSLPVNEWGAIKNRVLYDKDFYGVRDWVDSDRYIFDGNIRALVNGVAILTEDSQIFHNTIDENGNYKEPDIPEDKMSAHSLTSFFIESDYYVASTTIMARAKNALLDSYSYLMGYNYTIDRIAQLHDVPDFEIFKRDLDTLEAQIITFNDLVPMLYQQIRRTDYPDKTLRARKLQVLRDHFSPVDYKSLSISEETKKKADDMIANFSAFKPEKADAFIRLLYTRHSPQDSQTDG